MNEQLSVFDEKKMTIYDIAVSLNVTTRTITRYVEKFYPGIKKNGVKTLLNELQVTEIKLDLEKNKHLDTSVKLPKTDLEKKLLVQQAMNILNEDIEALQQQLESAQPAIEFHNQVGDSSGLLSIGEAAKMLGTGRNRFFRMLREKSIFMGTIPYQRYIEQEYFEVKTDYANEHVQKQAFVTGKGLVWLQREFK